MAPATKPILAPLLKAAGCATAFFLGGPLAGSMAAWVGEGLSSLFDEATIGKALNLAAGELPKGLSGGLGNFIAGAAYDRLKQAIEPRTLRPVFRQALAETLEAIRAEWIPTRPESERAVFAEVFDLWRDRLASDGLDELDDATIQAEFQSADDAEALKPILVRALIRLSHTGLSLQSRGLDPDLEQALAQLLPKHLPSRLIAALSGHDALWKQVMHRQVDHALGLLAEIRKEQIRHGEMLQRIEQAVGTNPPPPTRARLLTADSPALQPRHGAILGRETEVAEVAGRLATDNGSIVYVHGAPGIGKSEVCRAALRQRLQADPASRALFVDCKAAEGQLLARCAQALGDPALEAEQIPGAFHGLATRQPLLLYFDNFETVEKDPGTFSLLRELAATDGIRVLCSTRTDLTAAVGEGILIHRLRPQPAIDLFLRCWRRNTKAPALEPSQTLATFLDRQLSRHPLSIILTAALGGSYRSLDRLIAEWKAKGIAIAHSPEESLRASFSLSFDLLTADEKQFALLLALFPEGISAETWEDLANLEANAWDCRVRLSDLNLIDTPGSPEIAMLAPIREFVFAEASDRSGPRLDVAIAAGFRYYLPLAERAAGVNDEHASQPRSRMVTELPNLLALLNALALSSADRQSANLTVLSRYLPNCLTMAPLTGHAIAIAMAKLCAASGSQLGQANAWRNLGQLEFRLGANEKARASYEKALPLHVATGDQLGQANTWLNLGQLEFRLGANQKARASYENALQLYESIGEKVGQANTWLNLGQLEFRLGANEKARDNYEKALPLYGATGDQLGQANTLLNLGELEFLLGANEKARDNYEKALPLYGATGDQLGQANTLLNLGELEFLLGANEKARDNYEKALPLYGATGDQLGQANTLRNLGQLEFLLGANEKARDNYEKALPLYGATGSQLGQANTLLKLGQLEFRLGANEKARDNYEKALPLYGATGSQLGQANTLRNLGELEFLLGANEKARDNYEKALPLYGATGDQVGQANTLRNLGQLEFLLGANEKARDNYEKALPLYGATGSQLGQANTLRNLGQLEFLLGANEKARDNYEKALPLYGATGDQLGQANTLLNLGELEFRLGANEKARESWAQALALYQRVAEPVGLAYAHGYLALLDEIDGAHDGACNHLRLARQSAQRSGSPGVIAWVASLPIECPPEPQ